MPPSTDPKNETQTPENTDFQYTEGFGPKTLLILKVCGFGRLGFILGIGARGRAHQTPASTDLQNDAQTPESTDFEYTEGFGPETPSH